MERPFFSIVTPVSNGEKYLEKTITSIVNQSSKDFEYIIVDNMSTDNSREIIEKYLPSINKFISEKDDGMYDALNKGFSNCSGKYFFWLNSDDYLKNDYVLENIKKFLINNENIKWINCQTSFKYERLNFSLTFFPYTYPRKIIKNGLAHNCGWGFIQQESTMFSKELFTKVGGFNEKYKMAGDFYLWKKFSEISKLYPLNLPLGVQRKWEGQMQKNLKFYYAELNKSKCYFPILKYFRLFFSLVYFIISKVKKF